MAGFTDLNGLTPVKAVTGTYTVLSTDCLLVLTPNAASTVVTLPAPAAVTGQVFVLKQVAVASDQILVKSPTGNIDSTSGATGVNVASVNTAGSMVVVSDGTNYNIIASH